MIWEALITLAVSIATFLINLFPDANGDIVTSIQSTQLTIKTMIINLNFLMPVDVFFTVFGIILITEVSLFTWHAARWLITMVSGGIVRAK